MNHYQHLTPATRIYFPFRPLSTTPFLCLPTNENKVVSPNKIKKNWQATTYLWPVSNSNLNTCNNKTQRKMLKQQSQ